MSVESVRYSTKFEEGKFTIEITGDPDVMNSLVIQPLKVGPDIFHIVIGNKPVKSAQFSYQSKKKGDPK